MSTTAIEQDYQRMADYTKMAIELAGGTAALGRFIRQQGHQITTQAISQWLVVPPARVFLVEKATGGQITRHDLRPDIFGGRNEIYSI